MRRCGCGPKGCVGAYVSVSRYVSVGQIAGSWVLVQVVDAGDFVWFNNILVCAYGVYKDGWCL